MVYGSGLPRPIIKSHPEKSGGGFELGELLKISRFPYNIFATVGASDFKFGKSLGLSKPIIKSHAQEWVSVAWAREAPKNWEFSFSIYTMAKASNFKFGIQLWFAKAHHKITPRGKVGVTLG